MPKNFKFDRNPKNLAKSGHTAVQVRPESFTTPSGGCFALSPTYLSPSKE